MSETNYNEFDLIVPNSFKKLIGNTLPSNFIFKNIIYYQPTSILMQPDYRIVDGHKVYAFTILHKDYKNNEFQPYEPDKIGVAWMTVEELITP